jgi:hypothetical protein
MGRHDSGAEAIANEGESLDVHFLSVNRHHNFRGVGLRGKEYVHRAMCASVVQLQPCLRGFEWALPEEKRSRDK